MRGWDSLHKYSTAVEVGFVRYLALKENLTGFKNYAKIVLEGKRAYDPSVNVVRVIEEIERMRGVRL